MIGLSECTCAEYVGDSKVLQFFGSQLGTLRSATSAEVFGHLPGLQERSSSLSMKTVLGLLLLVAIATANIYLHNPRGSNNRLNENTATRFNARRLFDSQNNERGGYNAGVTTAAASGDNEETQYKMKYFQSGSKYKVLNEGQGRSHLTLEWTNQHGCGSDNTKQNCNIVFQYMCQETVEAHKGLFTADQTLTVNKVYGYTGAINTRQNPTGDRYGYECPEERDYFPYWHPSPWRDIAVLAENDSQCEHYQKNSFNVQPYHECVEFWDATRKMRKHYSSWDNKSECKKHGGAWVQLFNYLEKAPAYSSQAACESASRDGIQYIWAVPYDSPDGTTRQCLVRLDEPTCQSAPWSRSNHLGNGRFGAANNITWVLPYFPSGKPQACILRVRYNVSSNDYDPHHTDYRNNKEMSPVKDDPYIDVGAGGSTLKLAVDTAHFGHVFQDRTHIFILRPRPEVAEDARIYNLNVRGKRGNIVQAFPAVEYDFFPNLLHLASDDLVHIQWTGSNTHHNGGSGGDGEAGADGEGKAGTDRNNLVQISGLNENFPMPFENTTMWSNMEVVWIYHGVTQLKSRDTALNMASCGYFVCVKKSDCSKSGEDSVLLNTKLDNASPSYEGALLKFKKGRYHYMCTRNNNYTNRSQKGTLIVH
ncbi:Protein DD3-3 [Lamellibrachia satsuma]|nr:Protein DD3-3 [Lamellibrachia satsuma]